MAGARIMTSSMTDTEPFPQLEDDPPVKASHSEKFNGGARPRRKSSGLGGEPRGDTGAAAMSTLETKSEHDITPPRTPTEKRRHGKRRKARSLFIKLRNYCRKHTWAIPLAAVQFIIMLYLLNPSPTNPIHHCLFLSYPTTVRTIIPFEGAEPQQHMFYGKGKKDFAFCFFYTLVFSFTREFLMQRLIRPIAIHYGIRKSGKQARFMEQFYTAIYFAFFGPLGLYVMRYASPVWFFETAPMYVGFPHREHAGIYKAYYLLQASYWAQQAIVLCLMLEKPRKDFKELVMHHIVTLALIFLSYRFHFAYMGVSVYITHDISDFFLATSKVLNYLDSAIVGPYYALFVSVWIYTRHYLNLRILWSILTEFRTVGPFELNWETQQYKCWISQIITFCLLLSIQLLNIFWLFLVLRIGYRFLRAGFDKAKDERSDDEEEEEESEEDKTPTKGKQNGTAGLPHPPKPEVHLNGQPLEEVHNSTALDGPQTRQRTKKAAAS